jgi:hypothetical protein
MAAVYVLRLLNRTSLEDPNAGGFSRDQFGRQSMSEKRHAALDAKNTDTYQRNKKLRSVPLLSSPAFSQVHQYLHLKACNSIDHLSELIEIVGHNSFDCEHAPVFYWTPFLWPLLTIMSFIGTPFWFTRTGRKESVKSKLNRNLNRNNSKPPKRTSHRLQVRLLFIDFFLSFFLQIQKIHFLQLALCWLLKYFPTW